MWRKVLLFLFVISFLIHESFSSVSWHLEETNEIKSVRSNRRKENVHRGLLLSYSTLAKNVLCQDYYHVQLYDQYNYYDQSTSDSSNMSTRKSTQASGERRIEDIRERKVVRAESVIPTFDSRVTDDPLNYGDPTHAVIVKKLTIGNKALSDEEDIFFQCAIRDIESRIPKEKIYLLSSAFLSRWLYTGTVDGEHDNHVQLSHYMSVSPEFVDFQTEALEQKYVNVRETIEILRMESPRYIELVEKKDDLSALTKWQRFILCASILSSPIYRDLIRSSRLEVSKKWMIKSKAKLEYIRKNVIFSTPRLENQSIGKEADCMYCRGYNDFQDYQLQEWTDLCITRSIDNKHSAYVFEVEDEFRRFYVTKYFQNIPALINIKEILTDGNIVSES